MTAWAWAGLTIAGVFLMAALGDLVSEEIRGWLDLTPRAILRLAAAQLDADQRETIYQDEWLPELTYALRGAEARPITRLLTGIRYATGILIAARRVARHLNRTPQPEKTSLPIASHLSITMTLIGYAIRNPGLKPVRVESLGFEFKPGRMSPIGELSQSSITECRDKGLEVRRIYGPENSLPVGLRTFRDS